MADLHCHLLPGVDDGSKSVEQSVRVLRTMREEGTSDVCLTPHFVMADLLAEKIERRLSEHNKAFAALVDQADPSPRLHRGAEVMLDQPPREGIVFDRRLSIAGSRYLLIEFPRQLSSAAIHRMIAAVLQARLVPLLAHVERYPVSRPKEVFSWKEAGAVIQLDATAVARPAGERRARAMAILERGLADIVAADNHGDDRTLGSVWEYFSRRDLAMQAAYLLSINPQAILADRALEPVPEISRRVDPRSRLLHFRKH